jgi:hypothetical protein
MYESNELEVWNLTPGGTAIFGAQKIFNIVGRVRHNNKILTLHYSLNKGPRNPVNIGNSPRMSGPGDFGIDTIDIGDLQDENVLDLYVTGANGTSHHSIPFFAKPISDGLPYFKLDFDDVNNVEEIGQVIDGRWLISKDAAGRPCLEIRPQDAGYDRLIGFGSRNWTTGYEINALITVTHWTARGYFNTGLTFKWNPHLRGDGTCLPAQWSTGLAYYAAKCPGLRLRFGVDVHWNSANEKVGSYVLQETHYSFWRRWAGFVRNEIFRIGNNPITQLLPLVPYRFRLVVQPEAYRLTVWEDGTPEPEPQLIVPNPTDMLPQGCVGLIGCNCAMRVFEYTVRPINN